jgi:glutathione S-transferase
VIKLYQFPPVFGRNVSPFTLKLETWLKLAGLPYEVVAIRNPGQGPKGKLPFIEDDDGRFIADSSLIIEHLSRSRGIDLDAELDPRQRAEGLALQRLIEEHLYFVLVWSRWIDPEGWQSFGPALLGSIPPPVRQLVAITVRKRIRRALFAQGLGRHQRAEIYAMGRADLAALAGLLGARPFFAAAQPTTIDTIAYGMLANILLVPIESELKRGAQGFANLVAWTEAMERRFAA